jgi:hypothetical protein
MKPKDWFVVGVRLIGVWWLVEATQELVYLVTSEMGYTKSYPPAVYAIHTGANVLIGLFLISGARLIVRFADNWDSNDESEGQT